MPSETIFVPTVKDPKKEMAKWRLVNGKNKKNIRVTYETKTGGTLIKIQYG